MVDDIVRETMNTPKDRFEPYTPQMSQLARVLRPVARSTQGKRFLTDNLALSQTRRTNTSFSESYPLLCVFLEKTLGFTNILLDACTEPLTRE